MTYYTSSKKGKTLHDLVHKGLMLGTTHFCHFNSATVSLRIHVESLNDERGKEKDGRCRRLYY